MKTVLDLVAYVSVRTLFGVLALLPQGMRVGLFSRLFRLAFVLIPKLRKTSLANLQIAFPGKSPEWRHSLLRANCDEMGRLLADMVRLPSLDADWAREHVRCEILPHYVERLVHGRTGVLIATGHLGSFELLGHAIGLFGYPLSAVARKFRSQRLDQWWTSLREARGNTIIDRRGAFKAMVADIQAGRSVAVLFDQNVTRNHAVFPTWFGVPAATTKALALAAIKTEAPLFVASMRYRGGDAYSIEAVECETGDVYGDDSASLDEKVLRLTQRLSDHYCRMIEGFPEGWFWLHRRWKTRPSEGDKSIYS